MPGPSPAPCTFPDDFVQVALDTVRRRTAAVQVVQRFRLALLLHEQSDMKNDKVAKEVVYPLGKYSGGEVAGLPVISPSKTRPDAGASPFFPLWIKR
jgi:hypothetical protein